MDIDQSGQARTLHVSGVTAFQGNGASPISIKGLPKDRPMLLDYDDFDIIRHLICERSGIWLNDTKLAFLQTRVQPRMQALDLPSFHAYHQLLRYDARGRTEIQQLVNAVTVNESWFFREVEPLLAWIDQVLPRLLERPGPVQLWSAGCATGEEPYTVAILLVEALGAQAKRRIQILATDINPEVLDAAQRGIYPANSLRNVSAQQRSRFFTLQADGQYKLASEIRNMVQFKQMNLSAMDAYRRILPVDLLLCRNTLVYFEEEQRKIALSLLHHCMRPGGYLTLGHSESLLPQTTPFRTARFGRHTMYMR